MITFKTVEASLWQLMCLKGELVVTPRPGRTEVELLMKRCVLVQLFREMLLLERGSESNAFDIMLNLNYGTTKNSFSQQELNEVIILYAQHFFPRQYEANARALVSLVVTMALFPAVEVFLNAKKTVPFKIDQSCIQKLLRLNPTGDTEISSVLKKPSVQRLLYEVLEFYKAKCMTKQSHFFNDCFLTILRDFELCPYMISLKDCFVLYRLVSQGADFTL